MENKDTEYKEDKESDDFIKFLFGKKPQEKNTITISMVVNLEHLFNLFIKERIDISLRRCLENWLIRRLKISS